MSPSESNQPISPPSIIYRNYKEGSDKEQLLSLIHELQGYECTLFDRMKQPETIGFEYIEELHKSCNECQGEIIVAVIEQSKEKSDIESAGPSNANTTSLDNNCSCLVGYAVILTKVSSEREEETTYEYGEITDLAVTERYRHRGIGTQLLKICEDKARVAGGRYLRTEVLATNQAAIGAYQKFGFDNHLISMEKRLN